MHIYNLYHISVGYERQCYITLSEKKGTKLYLSFPWGSTGELKHLRVYVLPGKVKFGASLKYYLKS